MKTILAIITASLIGLGAYVFAAEEAPAPVNDKCPVSGKAINPDKTISVGFCCGNCVKKFSKDVKANLAKVDLDNKDGDTVNKACPISGKGIKKTVTVGFCCGKCQGKYAAK